MKALFAGMFGLGIILIFLGGFVYLWLKIWHIFGWVLVYTFVVSFLAALPAVLVSKSRVVDENEDSITYNPKEWPLYLNLIFGLGVSGYLYQYLVAVPELSDSDYNWGMVYLGFNILSIVTASLNYFANRNDQIVLTPKGITVLDMEMGVDEGFSLAWDDISEAKRATLSSEIVVTARTDKDSPESYSIKLKQMNMQGQEISVFKDIQDYLSRYGTQISESSSNTDTDALSAADQENVESPQEAVTE